MIEEEVHQQFRLNKAAILELYEKILLNLNSKTKRSHAVTGVTKLLSVLYFMASGLFQHVASSRFGISQPTFCRILKQVLRAMMLVTKDYIKFPTTNDEILKIKEKFFNIAGFPNFEILDIVPNFPGSCHDSYILQGTELFRRFQRGDYGDSLLLGDNGYRLNQSLMTPYLSPSTSAELRFNHAHKKTRSIGERTFGIWKSRFRCLDVSGGALLYEPKIVCQIIIACAILHNIANAHNLETSIADDLREEIQENFEGNIPSDNAAQLVRQQITVDFFGNRL
ncbi:putative nuclease HARBI1 [Hyla sarda]|uniref:putative nuclease HARBI1 n=1 Tax=Hyla sarda TaxID=327740 RepID=UPI0024C41564|nr:putative nuclease HARBI1 [Hyla sarda]